MNAAIWLARTTLSEAVTALPRSTVLAGCDDDDGTSSRSMTNVTLCALLHHCTHEPDGMHARLHAGVFSAYLLFL